MTLPLLGFANALQLKDLPQISPLASKILIQVGSTGDASDFHAPMPFVYFGLCLPSSPICLCILEEKLQIGSHRGHILFDDENIVAFPVAHRLTERTTT